MLRRALRFFVSTGAAAVTGQVLLYVFHDQWGWSAIAANIAAVAIGTALAFALSVRFVWPDAGSSRRSQIIVFASLSLLGLAVSTILAGLVSEAWDNSFAANVGSTAGFGLVWVIRFLVLDKTVFSQAHTGTT